MFRPFKGGGVSIMALHSGLELRLASLGHIVSGQSNRVSENIPRPCTIPISKWPQDTTSEWLLTFNVW